MTSEPPLTPRERDDVWRRLQRTLDQVEGRGSAARRRTVVIVRVAILVVIVGAGAALIVRVNTGSEPTTIRPMTVSGLAPRAADQPPYPGDLPSYLRVTTQVGGGAGVDESWLAEDGYGCFRSGPEGAPPGELTCEENGVLVGGLTLDQIDAAASSADPVGALESELLAVSPRSTPGERIAIVVQVLARAGVDPTVRAAAFELLDRQGYVVAHTAPNALVLEGQGQFHEVYVDPETTLVTEARGQEPAQSLTFDTGHQKMPTP